MYTQQLCCNLLWVCGFFLVHLQPKVGHLNIEDGNIQGLGFSLLEATKTRWACPCLTQGYGGHFSENDDFFSSVFAAGVVLALTHLLVLPAHSKEAQQSHLWFLGQPSCKEVPPIPVLLCASGLC